MRLLYAMAAVLALSLAPDAMAANRGKTVNAGSLRIDDYAMRASLGNVPTSAIYLSVANNGKTDERLLSASCTCAGMAMLHSTTIRGGMASMDDVQGGFLIRPNTVLALRPGGSHIMLTNVKHRLAAGSYETVKLTFANAGVIILRVPVTDTPLADDDM